jgi:hypothetical protein
MTGCTKVSAGCDRCYAEALTSEEAPEPGRDAATVRGDDGLIIELRLVVWSEAR